MGRKPVIKNQILELVGECGCVSKQLIDQLPYADKNISRVLKELRDMNAIKQIGKSANKSYTLLDAGRKMLLELDAERYSPEKLPDKAVINRHPERAKASGDVQALLALSGFHTHQDDKPGLPASCADSLDADLPYSCYYGSSEIKRFFAGKNDNGLKYSRAIGVLLTPDNAFRVYNAKSSSMQFNRTGEKKLQALMPHLFPGYTNRGNTVLVMGDMDFQSATKIMHLSWPENKNLWKFLKSKEDKKEHKGELLDVYNLGTPLHFVPLDVQMIPILQAAKYPGGWEFLSSHIMTWLGDAWANGFGMFYAFADNMPHFLVHTLDLTGLRNLIVYVERTKRPVALVCAYWQELALLEIVVENTTSDEVFDCIRWRTIENKFFVEVARYLEAFYTAENRAEFPSIAEFTNDWHFKNWAG